MSWIFTAGLFFSTTFFSAVTTELASATVIDSVASSVTDVELAGDGMDVGSFLVGECGTLDGFLIGEHGILKGFLMVE